MSSIVPAYNGEALPFLQNAGNTVGSLTGTHCSIIVGSLLGDGAMRCKVNALLEINHFSISSRDDPVTTEGLSLR